MYDYYIPCSVYTLHTQTHTHTHSPHKESKIPQYCICYSLQIIYVERNKLNITLSKKDRGIEGGRKGERKEDREG